jgi:hypothetical protein
MRSGIWRGSTPVLVSLHSAAFPTDAEWDRHMGIGLELRAAIGAVPLHVLVLSDGGGPTADQRARLIQRPDRRPALGALVTSSRLAASIGTVMSATYPGVRVFPPRDFHRVLVHLDIAHDELPALLAHIRDANAELGLECVAELELTLARGS